MAGYKFAPLFQQAEVESRSTGAKTSGMLGLSFFARFRPTYFKNQFGQVNCKVPCIVKSN